MASSEQALCAVLFDIEEFRAINEKQELYLAISCCKRWRIFAHQVFPRGRHFVSDGRRMNSWRLPQVWPPVVSGLCRDIVWSFACSQYFTVKDGVEMR